MADSETAHELAKSATVEPLPGIRTITLANTLKQVKHAVDPKQQGRFANDSALPGRHTRLLYDKCKYREANVLCQLRTKHSRLNSNLVRINAAESGNCEYSSGQKETVRQFLFECRRWTEQREPLLEIAGTRWGDLSFFLGGQTEMFPRLNTANMTLSLLVLIKLM